MNKYFITAIGTDIGKTIASAIIVESLKSDYWKPIQSGDLINSDSKKISTLISNKETLIHPEKYQLLYPESPHSSAKKMGITIRLNDFELPSTSNKNLVIEGAGGVLVPINENKEYIFDLIKRFDCKVILIIKNYLGSINHSLLTINFIKSQNIKIEGIIFNGETHLESEKIICELTKTKHLYSIPLAMELNKEFVSFHANNFIKKLNPPI